MVVVYNVMYCCSSNTNASHARVVGGSSRKIMTYIHMQVIEARAHSPQQWSS